TDLFEENYFPSVPFHGGFGLLNLHGIPKPTYNAFALLHRLGTEMLPVVGRHETVDAWVVRGSGGVTALLTNHALPRHPISPEWVTLRLTGLPPPRAVYLERIDRDHANPRRPWQEMGAPEYLNPREVEALQENSRLVREPLAWVQQGDGIEVALTLP